ALGFRLAASVPASEPKPPPASDRTPEEKATPERDRPEDELPLLEVARVETPQEPYPWQLETSELLEPFDESTHLAGIDRHAPLFDPRSSRRLLGPALATARATDEIDAEAAVEIIASGRPLDPVPLSSKPSLTRGARLLVDVGAGMAPFARDAWQVVEEAERV